MGPRGSAGPNCHPPAELAIGEVAGDEVTTHVTTGPRRTYQCIYRGHGAQEQAHRHPWRRGGSAHRRLAISGREVAREVAWELHQARAVLVRVKGG